MHVFIAPNNSHVSSQSSDARKQFFRMCLHTSHYIRDSTGTYYCYFLRVTLTVFNKWGVNIHRDIFIV
ncbi:hypothetical protein EVA_08787 [gut metagenome]|uniref:Uncharacterized protein n=1 Tax=gut metagenome TaxID=749906 RepID=J9GLQ3_9ZZZZ